MTNKEYIFKYHEDVIVKALSELGACNLCDIIGCREFCRKNVDLSCSGTLKTWLNMEHVEELFPIGTVVEFDTRGSMFATNRFGYYNGSDGNNMHRICIYKENIGKPHLGFLVNTQDIKKVGN